MFQGTRKKPRGGGCGLVDGRAQMSGGRNGLLGGWVQMRGGRNYLRGGRAQMRDLGHVIERENAAIGVFLSLDPPTKPMLTEAAEKGFYHSPGWNQDYPRLQILTVEDLLSGKTVGLPPNLQTYKQAEKVVTENKDQGMLGFE